MGVRPADEVRWQLALQARASTCRTLVRAMQVRMLCGGKTHTALRARVRHAWDARPRSRQGSVEWVFLHVAGGGRTYRRRTRAHACSWPWRVTRPPRRERASATPAGWHWSSARRRAKGVRQRTKRCATGAGNGETRPLVSRLAAEALRRRSGAPSCTVDRSAQPRLLHALRAATTSTCSCCVCHARCCWTRLALWRAGVSAGRPAARRAAACRLLRAPHTGGPAGALQPTLCCTQAKSYNTPVAAGCVWKRTRGWLRFGGGSGRSQVLPGAPQARTAWPTPSARAPDAHAPRGPRVITRLRQQVCVCVCEGTRG